VLMHLAEALAFPSRARPPAARMDVT